jgi:dihydropteroate synthase
MPAPARTLRAGAATLELGSRPLLMGIVNATPDSFSDGGERTTVAERVELARELVEDGADVIDVGGESAVTDRPPVPVSEEIERVVPLIERIAEAQLGVLVSVDTYKPEVAEAAVAVGASIVNDVSGLLDPRMADVCATTGAALVVMHTRAAPKHKVADPHYDDVVADVREFLSERIEVARAHAVATEQLILDPGPDFAKTPAQSVEVLRSLRALHELGRPLLLAVSRKDFVGAITGTAPRARLAGTLAAVGYGVDAGAHILRVHDVREAAEFLAVRAALRGETEVDPSLRIADELRWQRE